MKRNMMMMGTLLTLLLSGTTVCTAQIEEPDAPIADERPIIREYKMNYTVTLDTVGHYLNVRMDFKGSRGDNELVLNMPVWTPGYYEILNFPKHLCDFAVTDGQGAPLPWRKDGKNRWRIPLADNIAAETDEKDADEDMNRPVWTTTAPAAQTTAIVPVQSDKEPVPTAEIDTTAVAAPIEDLSPRVTVTYRVYANERDVASSRVEHDIAFVAPAGVFMHRDGDLQHPVNVAFRLPANWQKIVSGLKPNSVHDGDSTTTFSVPDFDTLYDSPFLLGNYYTSSFTHEGHDYEFALETPDGIEEVGFEKDFRSIVSAATKLMGDVPYDNYCLMHMGKGGGGLEHFNSQACYTDGTYRFESRFAQVKFLAFVAHEYFHLYNVKCIRPAELWPINYDREAFTPMLWVSEGLTCYYEFRLLRQAGIATPEESLELLTAYFSRYAPHEGQRHMSLRQSSYDIWLNFMNSDANERDVRVNYYFKGPIIGLLMDIDIRRKTQQRASLDDLMRRLYNKYYKDLHRGFTEEEFWADAAAIAGEPLTEIRRLVDTTDEPDYDSYLREVGITIDRSDWSLHLAESPTAAQRAFRKAMSLE